MSSVNSHRLIIKLTSIIIFHFSFFIFHFVNAQSFPTIQYEDKTYEANIKTFLLYPMPNRPDDIARTLYPPVVGLSEDRVLVGEFDDLSAQYRGFRFKVKHCNADWTPSVLSDVEFTFQFNDNTIQQYEASFNAKIPYYHYRFELPKFKLAGNYVLMVYEDVRPAKLIATKRFMIYDSRVRISPRVQISSGITEQNTHQQVDFDINYGSYELISPQEDLKIVVRQNFRWDKILTNLKPTNLKVFESQLEYRPFDLSNNFAAGNDYRWIDTRIGRGSGINITEFRQQSNQTTAYLRLDVPRRGTGAGVQAEDLNGQFIVENKDAGNSSIESDYLNVVFSLKIPEDPTAKVFVNGGFNMWQLNDANAMTFNPTSQVYEASIFIKQGIINYDYLIMSNKNADEENTEGNYSSVTNDYEIFVYHRPPASRADVLIGYRLVEFGRK